MKKLMFLFLILSMGAYSQNNITVNKMKLIGFIYSLNTDGSVDTLLVVNSDSTAYRYMHMADPVDSLDGVNFRYFVDHAAGGHAILTLDSTAGANGFSLTDQQLNFTPSGFLLKSIYDTNNDSIVENAKLLNGGALKDSAFSSSWNGSQDVATRNAVYDKFITAMAQDVYLVSLPSAASVAARIAAGTSGVDWDSTWTLAAGASPIDLVITHNLNRRVASVTIFAVNGTEEQLLFNTVAYNGIVTTDANTLKIQSFCTVAKTIKIYIVFK
jgi:hypothetical protein